MIQQHGRHVFYVKGLNEHKNLLQTAQGPLRHFRGAVYLRDGVKPNQLPPADICLINNMLDRKPILRNTYVKMAIAYALDTHFANQRYVLYEVGCGTRPIVEHINGTPAFHGIEIDTSIISQAKKKNLLVTHWKSALKDKRDIGVPKVCTAIYSQHYLKPDTLLRRIKKLINSDGFYIGNTISDHSINSESALKTAISRHGLRSIGSTNQNGPQYWCIFHPEAQRKAYNFWSCFQKSQIDARTDAVNLIKNNRVPLI